jgi:predicted  nucleic acid-binding Zn-ribbon protein
MWRMKGCIHCGGDIFIERDQYGWYQGCIQCGRRRELDILAKHKKQSAKEVRDKALATGRLPFQVYVQRHIG